MTSPASLSFFQATQQRRSLRQLLSTSPVSEETVIKLARDALEVVPSAFNSQTTRLTILFGDEHRKLWSITADCLLGKIGQERYNDGSKQRIEGFASSYATILFWDDLAAVETLKENCPSIYKDKVDEWIQQSNGMHQYFMWTALEAYGFGVNVQHYNPLIDETVKKSWVLPDSWILKAQMVFGTPKEGSRPGDRVQKYSVDERLTVEGSREMNAGL